MQEATTSATEARRSGTRVVAFGMAAIILILLVAAVLLFLKLPDADAFNRRVLDIFIKADIPSGLSETKLLEILAQSGTSFAEVLASYRVVIFVLLTFSTALLIASMVFLTMLISLNRGMAQIEKSGIQVSSLLISREERAVYLNNMGFKLTDAAMETLCVLAEARMDDDVLTGVQIEAMISGKSDSECEEAAGATRIKRLRDGLGNQLVSELLVKNIARRGYMLSVGKDVIRVL